jgi:hypothetical protein
LYAFIFSPTCTAHPTQFVLFDLIIRIIFDEEYKLRSK